MLDSPATHDDAGHTELGHVTQEGSADQVEALLEAFAVPKRYREPRIATAFESLPVQQVPCDPHGTLSAWRLGAGPAVLLVHGFEDDNSLWDPLASELARLGRPVVAFDAPGHGTSDGHWGLGWDFADGIHAVADALGPIDAVVAHSIGVPAVLGAIREGFTPGRCVFIAPPLQPAGHDRWRHYRDELGVTDEIATAARLRHEGVIGPERTDFDTVVEFSRLRIPTLVVHSRDDEHMPVQDSIRCVRDHPSASLHLVSGLGHRRSARDASVVETVGRFLASGTPQWGTKSVRSEGEGRVGGQHA